MDLLCGLLAGGGIELVFQLVSLALQLQQSVFHVGIWKLIGSENVLQESAFQGAGVVEDAIRGFPA